MLIGWPGSLRQAGPGFSLHPSDPHRGFWKKPNDGHKACMRIFYYQRRLPGIKNTAFSVYPNACSLFLIVSYMWFQTAGFKKSKIYDAADLMWCLFDFFNSGIFKITPRGQKFEWALGGSANYQRESGLIIRPLILLPQTNLLALMSNRSMWSMPHTILEPQNLPDGSRPGHSIQRWFSYTQRAAGSAWAGIDLSQALLPQIRPSEESILFLLNTFLLIVRDSLRFCDLALCHPGPWPWGVMGYRTRGHGCGQLPRFYREKMLGSLWPRSQRHPVHRALRREFSWELWMSAGGRVGRLGSTEDKLNSNKWTLTDGTTKIPNPFSWVSWKHQQINWSIIFVSSS